jgi:hypothetical protein
MILVPLPVAFVARRRQILEGWTAALVLKLVISIGKATAPWLTAPLIGDDRATIPE